MLQLSTLQFLKNIKKNNNKLWFDEHRKQYEAAKADFLETVAQLINHLSAFDSSLSSLAPKNCIFRINRDIRFSKDKSPYKTNMGAYFIKGKKGNCNCAGYYLHIEPGKSFAAGGIWMPDSTTLAGIRQEIDYNFDEWKKIINNTSFKKTFPLGIESNNILTKPPKGYEETNPAIAYLKMKSFIVSKPVTDDAVKGKSFVKDIVKTFSVMNPLIHFLNRTIEQ